MKAANTRVAIFSNADPTDLQDDLNKFFIGEAVSGSATFAADFIKEKELLDIQFIANGTNYAAMVTYTE